MNRTKSALFVAAIFSLLTMISRPATAQEPGTCTGGAEFSGRIEQIIDTSDGLIYAVGEGGTYWSCDNGLTWTGGGQPVWSVSIVRDPRDSTKVIVGNKMQYGNNGTGDMPESAWSLVARQDGTLLAGGYSGIWMSADFGDHWTFIEGTESSGVVESMLVDPNNDLHIMASSAFESFRSLDGGYTWDAVTSGVPTDARDFEVDPSNSSVFYAAADLWLLRSSDGGFTWEQAHYGWTKDITFDPTNPLKAYLANSGGNIAFSTDGGNSWSYLFDEWTIYRPYAHRMYVAPNGRVITGTVANGIFYSNDGGASWIPALPGVTPPGGEPTSGVADIRISIQRVSHNGSVSAGTNARFGITVTNYGPDDSTDTHIDISWTVDKPEISPFPGYTTTSNNLACCDSFTLRSGESVTIDFIGKTEPSNYADYALAVTATNAQSPEETYEIAFVTGTTPVNCGLVTCWEAPEGGGGSASILLLIALFSIAIQRRMRQP